MFRSTRSRRAARVVPLIGWPPRRESDDLLLAEQEIQSRGPSRRGLPAMWKRRGRISRGTGGASAAPAVELGALEPELAPRAVLLEGDGACCRQLVKSVDAHAEVGGGLSRREPAVARARRQPSLQPGGEAFREPLEGRLVERVDDRGRYSLGGYHAVPRGSTEDRRPRTRRGALPSVAQVHSSKKTRRRPRVNGRLATYSGIADVSLWRFSDA